MEDGNGGHGGGRPIRDAKDSATLCTQDGEVRLYAKYSRQLPQPRKDGVLESTSRPGPDHEEDRGRSDKPAERPAPHSRCLGESGGLCNQVEL